MYSEQQHYVICKLKELAKDLKRNPRIDEFKSVLPRIPIETLFGSYDKALQAAGLLILDVALERREPRILVADIELKPMKVWTWGIRDQYISHEQIIEDWSLLSWAAKVIGKEDIFYQDVSDQKDYSDDSIIVHGIWHLLNECDILVTQNGKSFDEKKLNTRFEKHKLGPPKPFKHVDALQIKKKKFGLTSNKLAYSTEYFNETFKKLSHSKYPGMQLWIECLKGNKDAWGEMKEYNIHDVLALEELYVNSLSKWDNTINLGVYTGESCCPACGSTDLKDMETYSYTKSAAYRNYQCQKCQAYCQGRDNELGKSVKQGLMK